MLIEFKVTNFRSLKGPQVFSMVAANLAEHRTSHAFDPALPGFEAQLLRSAAIYGANAAGKTNVLLAMRFMQIWILNSTSLVKQADYCPYKFSSTTHNKPSEFEITFVRNGIRYEYGFFIGPERIEREWLIEFINPRGRLLFERQYNNKKNEYEWKFGKFLKGKPSTWRDLTRPDVLFLTIACQYNSTQLMPVFEWFQKQLIIITKTETLNAQFTLNFLKEENGKERLLKFMQSAGLEIADIKINRETITPGTVLKRNFTIIENAEGKQSIVNISFTHLTEDNQYSELDLGEESSGTQTFFTIAGAWLRSLDHETVLFVDEIDSSLHPLLVKFLVQVINSISHNTKNSQLIVTTHNTTLLDQKILRRDQIWFVEKLRKNGSKLYSLAEFKPRNDEVIERWYLRGRYGALPLVDEAEE